MTPTPDRPGMYQHTQTGTVTRIATAIGLAVAVYAVGRVAPRPILWVVLAIAVLGVFGLSTMTIAVDQERFRFWFGPGWIHRSIRLAEIRSWAAVTNPWWYGWGIHLTPHGWLYNVGGLRAVQLELHDGRRLRVGSDEPERVCEILRMLKGGP